MNKYTKYVGKEARFNFDTLSFDIKIVACRKVFGVDEVQIVPLSGTGTKWIRNTNKITLSG